MALPSEIVLNIICLCVPAAVTQCGRGRMPDSPCEIDGDCCYRDGGNQLRTITIYWPYFNGRIMYVFKSHTTYFCDFIINRPVAAASVASERSWNASCRWMEFKQFTQINLNGLLNGLVVHRSFLIDLWAVMMILQPGCPQINLNLFVGYNDSTAWLSIKTFLSLPLASQVISCRHAARSRRKTPSAVKAGVFRSWKPRRFMMQPSRLAWSRPLANLLSLPPESAW